MSLADSRNPIPIRNLVFAGLCLLSVAKIILAAILDLYSDEIFYWQASTRPALAYSDLPFMTAFLAGLGSKLADGSSLAVRSIFIIMGATLPLLVYWIAKPVVKETQATEAAALSLCIPLAGFLGLLAVPDVPLVFFGLLSIGLFERAVRSNHLATWVILGIIVACGFSTHYRFFPYLLGAIVFLSLFESGRACWKHPGLWIALTIGCIGLVPILLFNLNNNLSGLGFHLMERHPWEFQATGFLHIFKQAILVTPLLYGVLIFTAWKMLLLARNGNNQAALLLCIALPNLLIFLVLAPWADSTSTSIHWPLSGYFPLLVFVPASLRTIYQWLAAKYSTSVAGKTLLAIPALGFIGTIIAFIGVGSQGFHDQLQPLLGKGVLSNKMVGWQEFTDTTSRIMEREFHDDSIIVITDNYYTLAQLEFGLDNPVAGYTIDTDKAVRDGRIAQYALWQKDLSGLETNKGSNGLFVTEDSTLTIPDKYVVMGTICHAARELEFLEQVALLNEEKRFSFYRVTDIGATEAAAPCPYPSQAWLDQPVEGQALSGIAQVSGWAFNEDIGVEAINLLVNGNNISSINYGDSRADVVEAMQVKTDPNKPNLGFSLLFNTSHYENGPLTLAIEIINSAGETQVYGERRVQILNQL